MIKTIRKLVLAVILISAAVLVYSCAQQPAYELGSYGYDAGFLKDNNIEFVELSSDDGQSKVMIVPAWQGRVATTTAGGNAGDSYGWINYKAVESEKLSTQFNTFGGEERLWFGPEGGPFSVYFEHGKEQVYENWKVPAVIDTESFDIKAVSDKSVIFTKKAYLENASGTSFDVGIERTVSILSVEDAMNSFGFEISDGMHAVAYRSDNTITNIGSRTWSRESGLISIWMLSCFNPTPTTTVLVPYKEDAEGMVLNDTYFGAVPSDRMIVEEGVIYFRIDGEYRSKFGIPKPRAKELCGSYDSSKGVLTLLWCTIPEDDATYVNGQWGQQDDPFNGDVINAYNDGPTEGGFVQGPFYELESSSPGAELEPGQSLTHTQKIVHIQGTETQIYPVVKSLFGIEPCDIISKFER